MQAAGCLPRATAGARKCGERRRRREKMRRAALAASLVAGSARAPPCSLPNCAGCTADGAACVECAAGYTPSGASGGCRDDADSFAVRRRMDLRPPPPPLAPNASDGLAAGAASQAAPAGYSEAALIGGSVYIPRGSPLVCTLTPVRTPPRWFALHALAPRSLQVFCGIAALVLIGFVAWFILWRQKKLSMKSVKRTRGRRTRRQPHGQPTSTGAPDTGGTEAAPHSSGRTNPRELPHARPLLLLSSTHR